MHHSVTLYVIDRGTRSADRYVSCLCGWKIEEDELDLAIDLSHIILGLVMLGREHIATHNGIGLAFLDGIKPEAWSS